MASGGVEAVERTRPVENGLGEEEVLDHGEIERELDTLTLTGSTINDLELKLTRTKQLYQRTLEEYRQRLEATRLRLNTHIVKSEPFVDVWRRARQIQEASNRAAARFDKANSQCAAAKEMIRVAEEKLSVEKQEQPALLSTLEPPASPSALDLAWQEMLNHATAKVVETERERRESELEHKRILQHCQVVMEEYKVTERKLRSHITKSRPFYEQRFECNRRLQQIKRFIMDLEAKIRTSKTTYSRTLKKLETLNTEIHERRRSSSVLMLRGGDEGGDRQRSSSDINLVAQEARLREAGQEGRRPASASATPEMKRRLANGQRRDVRDTESLDSLQLGDMQRQFTGSTGSLPSIGVSSVSDYCPTPDTREDPPGMVDQSAPEIKVLPPVHEDEQAARDLVARVLEKAAAQLSADQIQAPEDPESH